jgi:putative transferase (TIGR04331 family)
MTNRNNINEELFVVTSINPLLKNDCVYNYFLIDSNIQIFSKISSELTIKISKKNRSTKQDLIFSQNFVDEKYTIFLDVLAIKFNKLNNVNYNFKFWHKSINFSLKRQITLMYDAFISFENNFNINRHRICILSKNSFYTPYSYENLVSFLKGTEFAQEQLFSLYIHCFYPKLVLNNTFEDNFQNHFKKSDLKKYKILYNLYYRLKSSDFKSLLNVIINKFLILIFSKQKPKIGILNSFFSIKSISKLTVKSKGNISLLTYNSNFDFINLPINNSLRNNFVDIDDKYNDRFDRFFYFSLKYLVPKNFIEGFSELESINENYIKSQPNLKYIFSEAWISNDYLAILIAKLQQKGVKHINNEHNFLSHFILGNNIKKTAELCDIFITLGWDAQNIKNAIKGSSLHEFALDVKKKKDIDLLYISHFVPIKRTDFFSGYTMFAEDGLKYLKFQDLFFSNLNFNVINKIHFRSYPDVVKETYLNYDENQYLIKYINKFKTIDDFKFSGKYLMTKSKLIVLSYISTGFLEALLMNIPVIAFLNTNSMYLVEEYSTFFDQLAEVGIIQTSPEHASDFVNTVNENPNEWWYSESVQKARLEFIQNNIGEPNFLIDYILKLNKN